MKKTIAIVLIILLFIAFKLHIQKPFSDIRNLTISEITVSESKVTIVGKLHLKYAVVENYMCTNDDDSMYIEILMSASPFDKRPKTWFFKRDFNGNDNISKIYLADKSRKILLWKKSFGYGTHHIGNIQNKSF